MKLISFGVISKISREKAEILWFTTDRPALHQSWVTDWLQLSFNPGLSQVTSKSVSENGHSAVTGPETAQWKQGGAMLLLVMSVNSVSQTLRQQYVCIYIMHYLM